jgi:hypothetical protein
MEVIALPNAPNMQFRLCLIASTSICRLDFTDETHANPYGGIEGLPPLVDGPHCHSWRVNRRFFHNSQAPIRLYNAEAYTGPTTSFDNILRWFCADIHAESLPHDHRIQLPLRDQLW